MTENNDAIATTNAAPAASVITPTPSILTLTTAEQAFKDSTAADVLGGIRDLIVNIYLPRWSRFWGIQIGSGQQVLTPQVSGLSIPKRVAALGTSAVSLFAFNTALKDFIEGVVNDYLQANGVPPDGSNLAYLLPFVTGTTFSLPGVPKNFTLTFAADGSATCVEA